MTRSALIMLEYHTYQGTPFKTNTGQFFSVHHVSNYTHVNRKRNFQIGF